MADLAQVEPAVIEAQNGLIYFLFAFPLSYNIIILQAWVDLKTT